MTEGYTLHKNEIKTRVDEHNWQDIDPTLPELPTGIYSFHPQPQDKPYYQRLLHCLQTEQQSPRALHLTAYLLCLNTNNYYAMMLRHENFMAGLQEGVEGQGMLEKELYFASCLLNKNPKEYQVWNYKKDLLSWAKGAEMDLGKLIQAEEEFVFFLMTNDDEKNYHAWDYKTFLARQSPNLAHRLQQTESMLFLSLSSSQYKCESLWSKCYSCWSYRFNLIMDLPEDKKVDVVIKDCDRVLGIVEGQGENQCAWKYLEGLVDLPEVEYGKKEEVLRVVQKKCMEEWQKNRFAWSFLLHTGPKELRKQCLETLEQIDPIRHLYYQYLKQSE